MAGTRGWRGGVLALILAMGDGCVLQSARIDDHLAHSGQFSGGALALGSRGGVEAYAAEDHDLALFEVAHATLSPVGGARWQRTISAAQNYPHLARLGTGFLLGRVEGSARYLLELDPGGQALGEPVDLAGLASFDYGSPWQTLAPAGDVVWPRRAGTSSIEIVRVAR